MTQKYPVPPPAGSYTPANVPVITYTGGAEGDDVSASTANATNDFSPRHQTDKAITLGVPMVEDTGYNYGPYERPGLVEPFASYPVTTGQTYDDIPDAFKPASLVGYVAPTPPEPVTPEQQ